MSEINPDVLVTRRMLSGRMPDDAGAAAPAGEEPRKEREGLPSSYRMRADPHYVELLGARGERPEKPAPPTEMRRNRRATDTALPDAEPGHAFPEERAERLIAEVGDDLSTIASAVTLLASDPSPIARRVAMDLIRAETWRAYWTIRAHNLLKNPDRARPIPCDLGALLAELRDGFAAECRLAGIAFELAPLAWGATVPVDPAALIVGLAGAVVWALGGSTPGEGSVVSVSAEIADRRLVSIEVAHVSADGAPLTRRHRREPVTSDEWAADLGASAARTAARLHGAEASFLSGDGPSSVVRFVFR